ncbi:hypothetical protein SCA6_012133 [Theobroma cacao]
MSELPLSLLFLLFFSIPFNVISQDINTERTVLLNLKRQLGNPPSLGHWNSSSSPCDWQEIGCTNNSVTAVILRKIPITVRIPPTICDLKNLIGLDLSFNMIPGEFPTTLYNCSKLKYLDISQNLFVGPIPDDIDRLSTLTYLDICANNFSGNIPPSIGRLPELQTLNIHQNQFNGTFPKEIGDLSNLEALRTAYNDFVPMKIPQEFGQLRKLQYLWMLRNNLIGEIPESFNNLSSLVHFDLSVNNLEGPMPSKLLLFKNLTNLYLFHNKLSGEIPKPIEALNLVEVDLSMNNLTGSIPEDFGKLQSLVFLNLNTNQLTGELPTSIGLLPNLTDFRVFKNKLTGFLPPEFGLHSKLEGFEVSQNQISGPLPENLCAAGVLQGVASNSLFSGKIPKEITNLSRLNTLSLDDNDFSGELPSEIISWRSLVTLNVSNNKLSGKIPAAIGSLPDLINLDLSENQLSGEIPLEIGNLKLTFLNLSSNQLTGKIPTQLDNPAYENSFLDNADLCADVPTLKLPDCYSKLDEPEKLSSKYVAMIIALAILVSLVILLMTLFVVRDWRRKKRGHYLATWKLTSFQRLDFTEGNILSNLTDSNLIGSGGSGKVYKIDINRSGKSVAVKKIWNSKKLDHKLEKEFLAEVEILGNIRHFNIVKLLCCISSEDSKLLVYEYMENQSLDRWLHGKKRRSVSGTNSRDSEDKPIVEILDPEIKEPSYLDEMIMVYKVGIVCTRASPSTRPSMKEVLHVLSSCGTPHDNGAKNVASDFGVAPLIGSATYLSSYKRSKKESEEDDRIIYSV